jgi:membrane protein implicated in regulation of membrane protease activity
VLFLIALFLAIFVLPAPWGLVALLVAAVIDLLEVAFGLWYAKQRRPAVGVEALVGRTGVATSNLWPDGQVRVSGEIWRARCDLGCDLGQKVVVRSVEGLTLVVERA